MQDCFNALSGVALLVAASQIVLLFAVLSQLKRYLIESLNVVSASK
jgi:hypothetical protein